MSWIDPTNRLAVSRRPWHAAAGLHGALGAVALLMAGPFLWVLLTSLKTVTEALTVPPLAFPAAPQWGHYPEALTSLPFGRMYANTLLMALGRTAGQLILCTLAGYAFARVRFPGRDTLFVVVLVALMIPPPLLLLPQYQLVARLGWLNSLQALIVPGVFSAFGTFLLRQTFRQLPLEQEEAARLDGASHGQILALVMLPQAGAGLAALVVTTIIWSWNDLLWPLVVISSPQRLPLAAGLASLQGQYATDVPLLMAGVVLAVAPLLAAFWIAQHVAERGLRSAVWRRPGEEERWRQ